jgi:hypothetical protein
MNTTIKRSLLAGAAVATIGLGLAGAGIASANTAAGGQGSLIDKLATKFNLDKNEVAAVFQEDRQARHAEMAAKQTERLAQAVKDGRLTQAQADHITAARKEIHELMAKAGPGQADEATHRAIKEKMEALRTWAEEQNIDFRYVGPGGGHGPGGHGKFVMRVDSAN